MSHNPFPLKKNSSSELTNLGGYSFSRNLEDPNELLEPTILTELKKCLPKDSLPYIFAIDQEGGTVARIKHPKADPGPSLFLAKEHSDQKALLEIEGLAENLGNSL